MALPSLALAHAGHDAPVFHAHSWETGLAVVGVIAVVGFGIRALRGRK